MHVVLINYSVFWNTVFFFFRFILIYFFTMSLFYQKPAGNLEGLISILCIHLEICFGNMIRYNSALFTKLMELFFAEKKNGVSSNIEK